MRKRWLLLTTDDADNTLGEGRRRFYGTLLEAAQALAHTRETYGQIIHGDEQHARELTDAENRIVDRVLAAHGIDSEQIGA